MKKDKIIIILLSFVTPIIVCLTLKFIIKTPVPDKENGIDIFKTLLGVWATLLGFIVTAESILIAMGGKEDYIQAFKNSKHYNTVLFTYSITGLDLFFATAFSIFVICSKFWNELCYYILLFLIVSSMFLIFFCLLFLQFMISHSA